MVKYQKKEGKGEGHMKKVIKKNYLYIAFVIIIHNQRLQFELQ